VHQWSWPFASSFRSLVALPAQARKRQSSGGLRRSCGRRLKAPARTRGRPSDARAACGWTQREQALGWALLLGVGLPLPEQVADEQGELIHDGVISFPAVAGLSGTPLSRTDAGGHHT
jgi:hypothetical protein